MQSNGPGSPVGTIYIQWSYVYTLYNPPILCHIIFSRCFLPPGEILNSMGSPFGGVDSNSGPMDSSGPVGPPSSSSATQLELD